MPLADNDRHAAWREHYQFASHELLVDEKWRMHYLDEGLPARHEPTLLFVHGNPTWSFHWRRLITALCPAHRCIAMDHIGCGLSEKPAYTFRLEDRIRHVEQLIESLDLQNVTLVAQDWGGAIGLGAMLRQHHRLGRIMLLNTGAFRPWFIPWRIRVCRTPLLGRSAMQGGNLFSRAALRMTMSRKSLPAEIANAYLAPHDRWSNRRAVYDFVEDIPLSDSHPTWKTLGAIEDALPSLSSVPIRLVWGMRDWCFTPECLRRFQAVWPDAVATELADAGHWIVEDAPNEVESALRELLGKQSPAGEGEA